MLNVRRGALLVALLVAAARPAGAAPGDLDPTFGVAGVAAYHFPGPFINDKANAVAVQSDGKVVVAGTSNQNGTPRVSVVRWNTNGTLDATFGTAGTVLLNLTGGETGTDILIQQQDGKIVVGGVTSPGGINDYCLLRFTTAGVLDPTWGTGGVVTTNFIGSHDVLGGIVQQSDDKIVAVGTVQSVGLGVVRYNTDGSLDTSFGTGGKYTNAALVDVRRVALQPTDGKIVAVGTANKVCNPCGDFGVARVNTNGTTDTGFGVGGVVAIDLSGPDRGQALAIQPDGAIVVVGGQGWGFSGASNFGIARLLSTGAPDSAFGSSGKLIVDVGGPTVLDEAFAVVLEPGGGITVAGEDSSHKALVRLTAAGALDPAFGTGGIARSSGGGGPFDLKRQTDGRLVAAGGSVDLYAARYFNNVCADGTIQPGEQCDDANAVNGDCCSSACLFEPAATVCRLSAGVCDPAEQCTGASANCPGDVLTANGTGCADDGEVCTRDVCDGVSPLCQHPAGNAGTPCRVAGGACDPGEQCDGTNPTCPADAVENAGTPCPSDGAVCTLDACDGAGACAHPAGNAGTLCRASAGVCDVAEVCDGAGVTCPADAKSTAVCRAAIDDCDATEACDGLGNACPADGTQPDGNGCDDADACTQTDACQSGTCIGADPLDCDDGNGCTSDSCEPMGGCVNDASPATGCLTATKSSVLLKSNAGDHTKDKLLWKWIKGAQLAQTDLADPTSGTAYALCVYAGPTNALVADASLPPGAGWSAVGDKGYTFKGSSPDGLSLAILKGGAPGKSKAIVKGQGVALPDPTLPIAYPVTVQLKKVGSPICLESAFTSTNEVKNDGTQFKAKK